MLLSFASSAQAADLPATTPPPIFTTPAASFFLFSDTTVSYHFNPTAREPGVTFSGALQGPAPALPKNYATLTHVDAYKYGTNFFNVDFISSTNLDPAAPNTIPNTGTGAFEIYALYRGTLSGNAVTNSHEFSYGFVKDISLGYGGDINTKDTLFAPRKRDLVIGPQVSFDVPGFLTIEVNAYKEWNHNAFGTPTTYADFRVTPEFEVVYLQPLDKYAGGLPLSFSGFFNVVMPKGSGGIAGAPNDTRTEILTDNRITLDVSKYMGFKTHLVDVFVGDQYWYNKFGTNHKIISGSIENTVFVGAALHTGNLFSGGPL